jgi:hypothetical protein
MKKVGIIVLIAGLLMLPLVLHAILAQDENIPGMPLGLTPEKVEGYQQKIENPAEGRDYLKQEWGKLVRNENTTIGKYVHVIFEGYDKIAPYINPVFKVVLGIEPSLSWLFILAMALWIMFCTLLYRVLSGFSTFSDSTSLVIAFAAITIMSVVRIIKSLAEKIIDLFGLLTSTTAQLIAITLIIILCITLTALGVNIQEALKEWKKKRRQAKMEEEIELLKMQGKSQKEIEKIITDTFGSLAED